MNEAEVAERVMSMQDIARETTPWEYRHTDGNIVGGDTGIVLYVSAARMDLQDVQGGFGFATAIGRLAAASPDLYTAARIAMDALESADAGDQSTETGWANSELCDAWTKLRDARRKAIGFAPVPHRADP